MSHPLTLILDSENLLVRLVDLARGGHLTPERLDAIAERVGKHLVELREHIDAPLEIAPLPTCAVRFHGPFGVIDGGLS